MNFEKARFNMVEQQIRPWEVFDFATLDLFMAMRREEFVPKGCEELAYADIEVPLVNGRRMLSPKIEAHIVQAVQARKSDNVLLIGAGSGFLAALLAARAEWVRVVEIDPQVASFAQTNLNNYGVQNCIVEDGDGARGWDARAPYDVIVATGSVPSVPQAWLDQLKPGGRLFAFVGQAPVVVMQLITCIRPGEFHTRNLFETAIDPLEDNAPASTFSF